LPAILSDENKLFSGRIGKPKTAICPKCGEVSIYVKDVENANPVISALTVARCPATFPGV